MKSINIFLFNILNANGGLAGFWLAFPGKVLLLTALPVAWARIYLGLHFPFDMVGALGTAIFSVMLVRLAADLVDILASRTLLRLYDWIVPDRSLSSQAGIDGIPKKDY